MVIAEVIGKVTLSKCHESLNASTWRIAVPLDLTGIDGQKKGRGEPFVVFDEIGSDNGSLIAVSEGAEAAAPFHPDTKPIDAYNAAILDQINVEKTVS